MKAPEGTLTHVSIDTSNSFGHATLRLTFVEPGITVFPDNKLTKPGVTVFPEERYLRVDLRTSAAQALRSLIPLVCSHVAAWKAVTRVGVQSAPPELANQWVAAACEQV